LKQTDSLFGTGENFTLLSRIDRLSRHAVSSTICYGLIMLLQKHNCGHLKTTHSMWLLLCVCFLLASVAMPVYSVQKIALYDSMPKSFQGTEMDMPSALHHSTTNQQHHVENGSNSPCDDPGCDSMSDCSDNCTMTTCCSTPSASNAYSSRVLMDHHSKSIHRLTDRSSVLSRRSEPLFRPPIL